MRYSALHYNGSLWVATGWSGIYYSSNGTSWTKVTGVVIWYYSALHYNGSLWVATGYWNIL